MSTAARRRLMRDFKVCSIERFPENGLHTEKTMTCSSLYASNDYFCGAYGFMPVLEKVSVD